MLSDAPRGCGASTLNAVGIVKAAPDRRQFPGGIFAMQAQDPFPAAGNHSDRVTRKMQHGLCDKPHGTADPQTYADSPACRTDLWKMNSDSIAARFCKAPR